ncbi:phenoloxidase-activating factor 3-like isoform X2 [Drosophila innubila]|uniref:phenoloxidase-activating factor 3-like isoform X2 n=1 Tax=Drosophila innubila TaxID=198719 RepID=UPI00148C1165|nr:phenoloxidase-activating factor 3-like isoform X2 [Drosophila innubila]
MGRRSLADEPNCGYLNEVSYANPTHVADLSEFPWIGRVGYQTDHGIEYKCLAVLISKQHLLAPAECFVEKKLIETQVKWVLLGDWNPRNPYLEPDCDSQQRCNPETQLMEIEEIIIQPNYNNPSFASNIALLKLVQSVNFSSHIRSICLRANKSISYFGQYFHFGGFAVNASIPHKLKGTTQIQKPLRTRATLYGYNYISEAISVSLSALCGDSNQTTPLLRGSPLMAVNVVGGKPQSYVLVGLLQIMKNEKNSLVFIKVQPHIEWIKNSIQSMTDTD